ncbi:MAG TPA: hypothetical protein VLG11_03940 [Candidatus Saccharimonadales bacterium]|nr:hypothetical protein [Candidatus Saccharimonadales bacterium]
MLRRIKDWIDPPLKPPFSYELQARRARIVGRVGAVVAAGAITFGAGELAIHISGDLTQSETDRDIGLVVTGGVIARLVAGKAFKYADRLEGMANNWREDEARYAQFENTGPNTYAVAPVAYEDIDVFRGRLDPSLQTGIFARVPEDARMPQLPPETGPAANGEA